VGSPALDGARQRDPVLRDHALRVRSRPRARRALDPPTHGSLPAPGAGARGGAASDGRRGSGDPAAVPTGGPRHGGDPGATGSAC
jgi:hypothetical protein